MAVEARRARLVAVDRTVHIAHRAVQRLDIRAMENAVAEIHRAARLVADRIRLVMRVRRVEAMHDAFLPIRLPVAVRVAHEPHVRRLHHEHAVLIKLEAGRAIQPVGERRALRELPGLRVNVEHEQLVHALIRRRRLGIRRPRGNPQPSARVEIHLHGIHQLGEFHLRRDELHLHTLGHLDMLHGLCATHVRHRLFAVRRHGFDLRQVVVRDGKSAALRHGPHGLVAVRHLHIALRELLAHDRRIVHALVFDARALAVNVVLVHGAVAVVPLHIFLQHRRADFLNGRLRRARRVLAEERLELHRRERLVTLLGKMHAIDRERPRRLRIRRLRRRKKIHKLHAVRLRHFVHRRRVEREVFVVRRTVGVVHGILHILMRDRREQHHARLAFAKVRAGQLLQILIECPLEIRHARLALERLIEAPIREDHVCMEIRPRTIHHVGVARLRREHARLHIQEIFRRRRLVAARMHIHLVCRETEIAHGQFEIGIRLVDQRLQPAMMLLPVRQPAANDGNMIALFQRQLLLRRCRRDEDGRRDERDDGSGEEREWSHGIVLGVGSCAE